MRNTVFVIIQQEKSENYNLISFYNEYYIKLSVISLYAHTHEFRMIV